jgi:hypothetical protein
MELGNFTFNKVNSGDTSTNYLIEIPSIDIVE